MIKKVDIEGKKKYVYFTRLWKAFNVVDVLAKDGVALSLDQKILCYGFESCFYLLAILISSPCFVIFVYFYAWEKLACLWWVPFPDFF